MAQQESQLSRILSILWLYSYIFRIRVPKSNLPDYGSKECSGRRYNSRKLTYFGTTNKNLLHEFPEYNRLESTSTLPTAIQVDKCWLPDNNQVGWLAKPTV